MYVIKKNGRRNNKTVFFTYEQARNYVRKLMRADKRYVENKHLFVRHPRMEAFGFAIVRK